MMPFAGIAVSAVVGLVVAALQAAAIQPFGAPLALLNLPLIAICARVSSFRFGQAATVALMAGLAADLFVAPRFIGETVVLLAITGALVLLFTHVLTNSSITALLALNAAAFALYAVTDLFRDLLRAAFSGDPTGPFFGMNRLLPLLAALPWQLGMVIAVATIAAIARHLLGPFIVFRSRHS